MPICIHPYTHIYTPMRSTQDDTCILTASGDQAIGLWHCGNATAYARFQGHSASVKALGQHPDNPCLFASGTMDAVAYGRV